MKIESCKKLENFNYADEYTGLSYLNNLNNNCSNNNNNNCNNLTSNFQVAEQQQLAKQPKKNSEVDFRVKYKTEKCKFWEINKTCKFGEGVSFF